MENLKLHIMIHVKQKPHPCEECGKGFIEHINLETVKTHMMTHTGEKPHVQNVE